MGLNSWNKDNPIIHFFAKNGKEKTSCGFFLLFRPLSVTIVAEGVEK
jgi:hypothetical protein